MKGINKIYRSIALLTAIFAGLTGCEKSIDAAYEEDARIYFFERYNDLGQARITNRTFSFLLMPSSLLEDTVYIKVKTMGNPKDYDRYTIGEALPEGTTAVEGVDYKFIPGLIAAGQVEGLLPIVLYRTERIQTEDVVLNLTIGETADFRAGVVEDRYFSYSWSDKLSKPGNWDDPLFGLVYIFGDYSDVKYRFIIDVLGISEFNMQVCARCELVPGEHTYAAMMDFRAQLVEALMEYNEANPENPLRDENENLVTF